MMARLLSILAVTLPLAACAAQPAASVDARSDAAVPAQAAPLPTAAQAAQAAPSVPASPPAAAPSAAVQQPAAAQDRAAPAQPARGAGAVRQAPAGHAATGAAGTPAATPAGTAAPATPSAAAAPGDVAAPSSATVPAPSATTTPGAATVPAPGTAQAPVPMQAGSPTGSLLQTLFALILVLAVLAALAWFLKRYGPRAAGGATANLRVVGSLGLGGRERLLVVEVGNQWIVVGASPGRVNALATMPKQDAVPHAGTNAEGAALAPHAPAANSFADWLRQTMDKRK